MVRCRSRVRAAHRPRCAVCDGFAAVYGLHQPVGVGVPDDPAARRLARGAPA